MNDKEHKIKNIGYISVNWGRQGGLFLAYLAIIFGFYGIIANIVMVNEAGDWISFLDSDFDRTILIWHYSMIEHIRFNLFTLYTFLKLIIASSPFLLLFFICFFLTYKEDVSLYGIRASIWLIPVIIVEGFIFYWFMFGLSIEPLILQFARIEGYLNLSILTITTILGSYSGMKLKQYIMRKKESTLINL
jgi:hypothetical protein